MIYLFGNPDKTASIVYDETTLTEEQRARGVAVEALPEQPENEPNKTAVLKVDKATGEVWYEQVPNPREQILEQELSDAIDLLIEGGIL